MHETDSKDSNLPNPARDLGLIAAACERVASNTDVTLAGKTFQLSNSLTDSVRVRRKHIIIHPAYLYSISPSVLVKQIITLCLAFDNSSKDIRERFARSFQTEILELVEKFNMYATNESRLALLDNIRDTLQ